jgi:hypothetical protein
MLVVMVMTIIVGVTLASYLHLVSNQNLAIVRSMAWNHAVAVSEAGIEEAMAHLNSNTTNRTRDGWTLNGTNVVKEKAFGSQRYKTYIEANAERPIVVSEGWVVNPKDGQFLTRPRVVRVATTNDALFAKGMVAKGEMDFAGNNITTDSYDATDPNYNTGGRYDPAKNKDGGDIATNSRVINVANANIYGTASTGPGGNIQLSNNGAVGSKAHHASGVGGIEAGWSSDDMNVYFPDVKHPYAGTTIIPVAPPTLTGGTVGGVPYDYILWGGNYSLPNLSGTTRKILVMGHSTLLVTGDINLTGQSGITIETNASLQLYMAGNSATLAGQGVMNRTGKASAMSYWGLPTNRQVKLQGNSEFTGTVYAPQAELVLGGGGGNITDFSGASVSGSVKVGGHFNFHYDESTGIYGPRRGYTIVTWNEEVWNEI